MEHHEKNNLGMDSGLRPSAGRVMLCRKSYSWRVNGIPSFTSMGVETADEGAKKKRWRVRHCKKTTSGGIIYMHFENITGGDSPGVKRAGVLLYHV